MVAYYDTKERQYHRPGVKWFNHTVVVCCSISTSILLKKKQEKRVLVTDTSSVTTELVDIHNIEGISFFQVGDFGPVVFCVGHAAILFGGLGRNKRPNRQILFDALMLSY